VSGFVPVGVESVLGLFPVEFGRADLAKKRFRLRRVVPVSLVDQLEMLGAGAPVQGITVFVFSSTNPDGWRSFRALTRF